MSCDDARIMELVKRGQLAPFDELVSRYRSVLIRVAESKLGDRTLAEDLVQETFLAVYAARESFNPQFSFRTWLWTILLNLCRRHLRRCQRRPRTTALSQAEGVPGHPAVEDESPSGLDRILAVEQSELLHACLDAMPEPQADALRLRFFGGLKFQEIADAMNCSLNGAKQRVRNGLVALAGRMGGEESIDHEL